MARSKRKSQTSPPGGLPLKLKFLIAAHTFAFNASRRLDGSLNRCLMNLFDPKSPANCKPIKGVASSDVTVDASLNLWFRLYTPSPSPNPKDPALPFILFFHGGGFALSAANSKVYDDFCRRLAFHVPTIVASVNNRRSPEHPFPTPYDDGITTLKFIDDVQEGSFLPAVTDLSHSFIAGGSASGNIAHHLAARAGEHVFKKVKIRWLVALLPFFGGEERTEFELRLGRGAPLLKLKDTDWFWKAFLPKGADRNHTAPVFGLQIFRRPSFWRRCWWLVVTIYYKTGKEGTSSG